MTLNNELNNTFPNVAKSLRVGGYQTAMIGKWHLGEGEYHEPRGFDYWSVLPGQGDYFDPSFTEMGETVQERGYATEIITDKRYVLFCIAQSHTTNSETASTGFATATIPSRSS